MRFDSRIVLLLTVIWLACLIPRAFSAERVVRVGAFHFAPGIFQGENSQTQGMFVDLHDQIGRAELLALFDRYFTTWRDDTDSPYYKAYEKWFYVKLETVEVTPDWSRTVLLVMVAVGLLVCAFVLLLRRQVKTTIKQLKVSEQRFRKAVINAPIPIMIFDEDGVVESLSKGWIETCGYSKKELPTLGDWQRLALKDNGAAISAEISKVFSQENRIVDKDIEIVCAEGATLVWSTRFAHISRSSENKKLAIMMASDVTDRLWREQELAKSEERYRVLFDQMMSGFALHEIICDEQGRPVDYRFLAVNQAFKTITGLSAEEVIGRTVKEVTPEIEDEWIERYGRVALTSESEEFHAYSTVFDKHFTVRAYSPAPGQFASVFYDITENKQNEMERARFIAELEARNVELEHIAYTISHDLKSPVVTISSFAGQLEHDLEQGEYKNVAVDLKYIRSAADKMKLLIKELLEYTRLGYVEEIKGHVTLSGILDEVLWPLQGQIDRLGFNVVLPGQEVFLFADRRRLVQLWSNLVENALKYHTASDEKRLEIGVEGDGCTREFFVCDNGIGIPDEFKYKIFDIFEKLDPEAPGAGIGLAIVKRAVTISGGEIRLCSDNNMTCFRFTLPLSFEDDRGQNND